MSTAAAVIMKRFKRIIDYLQEHGALTPDKALPSAEVPYHDRWFFRRLVDAGAIRETGERVYLDAAAAGEFLRDRRRCILWAVLLAVAVVVFILSRV